MPAFPQFASLPLELQRGIWQSGLDEGPEPVVEISNTDELSWGTDPLGAGMTTFSDTCKVYLKTSALMHACHVSREMARKQLKWSDILRDAWPAEAAKIRHLALIKSEMDFHSGLAGLVNNLGIFSGLRRVSLVCADDWEELREYDEDGRLRYRLVDYSETETISQMGWLSDCDQERMQK